MTALAARPRFLGALLAWSFFVAASPGVLSPDGSALLAALGVGVWGMVELRPYHGRPWVGFLAHTLGAMPGAAGLMIWVRHVYWPPLLWIGFGVAVYSALGGVVLRRLGRWLPLPLAVALAWTGSETLRTVVPNPFGLGWMRVGYNAHAHLWLSGSARFWGVGGLTFVLAAGGGLATALWTGRGRAGGLAQNPALRAPVLVSALTPLAVGVFLALVIRPPATVDGPRLLLIQPGFAQVRKQSDPWEENFLALRQLTAEGLAKEQAAGRPEPDLVCWGETMLYVQLFEEGVRALAVEERQEDETDVLARDDLRKMVRWENEWVREWLFGLGRPGLERVIPAGTSFLSGAEIFVAHEGEIRRSNAVVLYDAEARRSPHVAKRYLVPGAETMYGLERIGFVRRAIESISGYVPDFLAAEETGVLTLACRDGRRFELGITVCYDNAWLDPYTEPVRDAGVDFHLVVSNEAWYRQSFEVDQMMAFSRLAALASGRTIVRVTNSGISAAFGPDGRELFRIRDRDGRDREVSGTRALTVPVPGPEGTKPPFVHLRGWFLGLWIAAPLALALRRRRADRNHGADGG